MKSVEKELKYRLSQSDFIKFKEFLNNNKYIKVNSFIQINYYIDTKNFCFKEKDITVRIRKIIKDNDWSYEFTVKTPKGNNLNDYYKIKNEYTIILNSRIATNLITKNDFKKHKDIFSPIFNDMKLKVDLSKLNVLGELKTKRELYIIDKKYEPLNIDLNSYLKCEDYEIEWETEKISNAQKKIERIFYLLSIIPQNGCVSKNTRFFNKYL
ncbi:CYTH domain-containing protein [Clostridiaceae bacterium M8S5]|nr:CYTH domain-containing protein [Clostridiaceae bacterium M8S5]